MAGAIAPDLWVSRERLAAAALVLILHILFLTLIQVRPKNPSMPVPRETVVTFPITTMPAVKSGAPEKKVGPARARAMPAQIFTMPKALDWVPGVSAQMGLLSLCAIDNLGKLSLEQQRRCRTARLGLAGPGAPGNGYDLNSAVRNPARWQAELDRKNSPVLLPGGIFLPLLALGAVLGQDNILRHPDKWPTYQEEENKPRRQKIDEAKGLYRTPKLPGE